MQVGSDLMWPTSFDSVTLSTSRLEKTSALSGITYNATSSLANRWLKLTRRAGRLTRRVRHYSE